MAHYPVQYGLQNTGPNHRLPIAPHDGGAITSEPILHGDSEAMATVREAIAQTEVTRMPLSFLSLDFQEAFGTISHLIANLRSCGFCAWFVERIKSMYEEAASSIQINGRVSGPIPINTSVIHECPMGMLLFASRVDPLLRILEKKLPGIRIGNPA